MAKSIVKRIAKFNKDRHPELVKLKFKALTESPFRFFRGTCHLFYEDLPDKSFISSSPKTWICGDLHLENFGSFKGDNGLAYFDMNDFDEALLAPCLVDVTRLVTSIFLSSGTDKINRAACAKLAKIFLQSYIKHLTAGHIRFIEKETATGIVREFLDTVTTRKKRDMLAKRIDFSHKKPRIKADDDKAWDTDEATKKTVRKAVETWAKHNSLHPEFYKVLDVANRTIGTGSLGVERHLVLVHGRDHKNPYLLDLKEALPPSGFEFIKAKQPKWKNDAERIISIEKRVQSAAPAHLHDIKIGKKWFVQKDLQPFEDKIDFMALGNKRQEFDELVCDMGAIVAWNNLRCGGRQDSAIADDMIKFGHKLPKLEKEILDYTYNYALTTIKYWKEYNRDFKGE
ncbi:MAG: hypothetical protein JWO06_1420 [Bacteroidota bacterium]|nr:hypothetical protein [Bacteroidota bacterium]